MGLLFDRFDGFALVLLILSGMTALAWLAYFGMRWMASYPKMPPTGPETTALGDEPPAIVNFLAHRWKLTRASLAATFLDLAARRFISIDLLGRGEYVVRLRQTPATPLLPYEQQLLDLVRARATGGSAPLQVFSPGEATEADRFWQRFRKQVISDARDRGLARNRWAADDFTILGALLAVPVGLFALAMGEAGIGSGGTDPIGRGDWLLIGLVAWGALLAGVTRFQDLRDTPSGREVCARWLGVRQAFAKSTAFGDAPPSHVTLWERNLAYAAALGLAHDAVHALPFEAEDPETAWSRATGSWRELRVEYPTRFGFGMQPIRAVWEGLWRTVVFGFLSFVALPFIAKTAVEVSRTALEFETDFRLELLFLAIGIGFTLAGLFVFVRFVAGLIWLIRGVADLGKWVEEEGLVVKRANGRVAIDDGIREELIAWTPATRGPPALGSKIRIRRSPHLWYVEDYTLLGESLAHVTDDDGIPLATVQGDGGSSASGFPVPDIAAIAAATGLAFTLDANAEQPAPGLVSRQEYTDGQGNSITLNLMVMPAFAGFAGEILMAAAAQTAGTGTKWVSERAAVIPYGDSILTVNVDLVDDTREREMVEMVLGQLGG